MKKMNIKLFVLILCLTAYGSIIASTPQDKYAKIDSLLNIIAVYEYGMDRTPLSKFSDIVTDQLNSSENRDRLENAMTDFLLSSATLDGKQFMCEQLSLVASERSVIVLQKLLNTPETSDMARYALDRIPGIASDAALLDALENNTDEKIKLGSMNSLGSRQDPTSVNVIAGFLNNKNISLASSAATALGMIGNDKACEIISAQLPNYEGQVRDLLADSYLKCADNMLATGNNSGAEKIYSSVLQSEKNDAVRQAAFNGLLNSTGNPVELIVSTLGGDDSYLIEIAAKNIRILKTNGDILKVAALLSDVNPDVKVKILAAFEDIQNPVTHKYVADAVNDDDEFVSSAALKVLIKIGTKDDVELIANIAVNGKGINKETAESSLDLLNAEGTDDEIIRLLNSGNDELKAEMIRTVSTRKINSAYDVVYAAAASENKKLKAEAYKTLGIIAEPEHIQDLLTLLENAENDGDRKRVESSIVAVIEKIPDIDKRADQLIEHLAKTESKDVSYSILRMLAATGSAEAYNVLQSALKGDDEDAQKIVIEGLANWPGDEPITDLMNIVKTSSNETYKILALRSYITLVKRSETLTDDEKLADYKEALSQSKADNEKKMIISGIGRIQTLESLNLAVELLSDENLTQEAFIAVIRISEDIAADHPEEVKRVLNIILENTENEDAKSNIKEILGSIK